MASSEGTPRVHLPVRAHGLRAIKMVVKVTNPRDQVGMREEEGMRVKEERDIRKRILPVALRPIA